MRLIRALPLMLGILVLSVAPSSAQIVGVSIRVAPPPIPVYVQPPIPGPGYIWVPGYWAWGGDDYYWVPGTWVLAPVVGYLWTPGYWYWNDGLYVWRAGYWGPRVGFYGGINYGCGYYGTGYVGGHWRGRVFAYNTAVTNIGTARITNVYVDKTVIISKTATNVSFHGGQGGTTVKPTAEEQAAEHEKHVPPTFMQRTHQRAASTNRALFAKANDGKPPIATTTKASQFSGKGGFAAKDAKVPEHPALHSSPRTLSTAKGTISKGAAPTGPTRNSPKGGAVGLNDAQGVKKDQRTSRIYTGKGMGQGGPHQSGNPNGHPRTMTMRGDPHPPQGQGGRSPPEARRQPNFQGKRPDQGV